ncbi:MAG TPA: hypothetical protein VHM26_07195, partial [Chitinophagaceae bacterium]|nr:hypothetical protein [Chitinophagaceae bacterium]
DHLFRTADAVSNIFVGIGLLILENWLLFLSAIVIFFLFRFLKRRIPQKYHASIGTIIRLAAYIILMICAIAGCYSIIQRGEYDKLIPPVIGVALIMVFDYFGSRQKAQPNDGTPR